MPRFGAESPAAPKTSALLRRELSGGHPAVPRGQAHVTAEWLHTGGVAVVTACPLPPDARLSPAIPRALQLSFTNPTRSARVRAGFGGGSVPTARWRRRGSSQHGAPGPPPPCPPARGRAHPNPGAGLGAPLRAGSPPWDTAAPVPAPLRSQRAAPHGCRHPGKRGRPTGHAGPRHIQPCSRRLGFIPRRCPGAQDLAGCTHLEEMP